MKIGVKRLFNEIPKENTPDNVQAKKRKMNTIQFEDVKQVNRKELKPVFMKSLEKPLFNKSKKKSLEFSFNHTDEIKIFGGIPKLTKELENLNIKKSETIKDRNFPTKIFKSQIHNKLNSSFSYSDLKTETRSNFKSTFGNLITKEEKLKKLNNSFHSHIDIKLKQKNPIKILKTQTTNQTSSDPPTPKFFEKIQSNTPHEIIPLNLNKTKIFKTKLKINHN
jgi:hypothetical protein